MSTSLQITKKIQYSLQKLLGKFSTRLLIMRFFYQVIPHNELHSPNNWEELANFYLKPITRAGFEQEVQEVFGCQKQVVLVHGLFYLHEIDLQQLGHRQFLFYEADQYLIASSIPNGADGLNVAVRAIFRELEFPPED